MARPALLEFHDPEVARLFHEEERAYLIIHFVARPKTIESAAAEFNLSISTMRRWVNRFVQLGLLKAVGVNAQRAQLYQLAAERVIIHDKTPPPDTVEDFNKTLGGRWVNFVQSAVTEYNRQQEVDPWVLVIQGKGENWGETLAVPRSQAQGTSPTTVSLLHNEWLNVALTPQNARMIASELEALCHRIGALNDPEGTANYLVHLGFVKEHP